MKTLALVSFACLTLAPGAAVAQNLALGKPATGSTSCNTSETPAKAVNGSVSGGTTDKWCSLAATKWLQVDLGAAAGITQLVVRHAGAGGESTTYNTRDFNLQTSPDAASWTTAATVAGNTASTTTHTITPQTARYVRLNVTAAEQGGGGAARIYELEVYGGTTNPTATPTPTATPATPGSFVEITPGGAAVSASANDGNLPANTVDGSLATRWSASGDGQWIRFDLGVPQVVARATIGFYNGNTRRALFDLQVSNDNASWTNVFTGAQSSGTSTQEQLFDFPDVTARYVRYLGHGNSSNLWNSLTEVSLFTPSGSTPPPPTPTPTPTPSTPTPTRTPTPAATPTPTPTPQGAPPATWQEHWFEHVQNVSLIQYNDTVALYFDADVNRAAANWMMPYLTNLWNYARATYGNLNQTRLFSIHHEGRYFGGHPAYWYDAGHDFRNVSDVGGSNWATPQYEVVTHETAHIVESVAHGKKGSPAFGLWGDSKWAEFYIYDAYVALGMTSEAQNVYNRWIATSESYPRPGTFWFRDWFYPLWRDHGHAQVMVRFNQLLGQYYPTNSSGHFSRNMNMGEFVHFMSGAAGTNLKARATTAFGWPAQYETEWNNARAQFPQITY
jgi:hypothetical protein